jgi:hypothetical protein
MPDDISGRFSARFKERYYVDDSRQGDPVVRCRRCDEEVGYLTKHAVVRHGDDIEVMPLAKGHRERDYAY